MRLWSLHPSYLDAKGLVALWRETLLAQAVLLGRTKGYAHHPQLERFHAAASPSRAVADYLRAVAAEAALRGYRFDTSRIVAPEGTERLRVTNGQMETEWQHLRAKLATRDPGRHASLADVAVPLPHPLFDVVPGDVEPWERARPAPPAQPAARTSRKTLRNPA
ncbi:pyrimidine dimer DNA glycosylase/endonuclease V [Dokdonella sp.]|uniref:pyrimidine dimer DNA glycosylase/endonuclease V n=1 Tax=Dokdonella sp. TaxID=2291710 RepID=UPI002626F529|nr:pyrimidine dimer DNA glycosylase/endonuclease V [Dokdonella sp.]